MGGGDSSLYFGASPVTTESTYARVWGSSLTENNIDWFQKLKDVLLSSRLDWQSVILILGSETGKVAVWKSKHACCPRIL